MRSIFLILFVTLGGLAPVHAEDASDVRGTSHGCVDVTGSGAWATLTSASLENSAGSAALAASLYWTEIVVKDGSAPAYICLAAAASCGGTTANKMVVPTGAALALPLRGISTQSVAVFTAGAATAQVCGYFRAVR